MSIRMTSGRYSLAARKQEMPSWTRAGVVPPENCEFRQSIGRIGIIVYDQDPPCGRVPVEWRRLVGSSGRVSFRQNRKMHHEFTAAPQSLAAGLDSAAVKLHQPLDHREADAEPAFAARN